MTNQINFKLGAQCTKCKHRDYCKYTKELTALIEHSTEIAYFEAFLSKYPYLEAIMNCKHFEGEPKFIDSTLYAVSSPSGETIYI